METFPLFIMQFPKNIIRLHPGLRNEFVCFKAQN